MLEIKRSAKKSRERNGRRKVEAVLQAANSHVVRHFPVGCLGRDPRRLVGATDVWIVPIYLTSPGCGAVGEVGLVAVEAATLRVLSTTQRREVDRAIRQLKESKRDELEAALHRARAS
jgi:hypothetical protein